MKEELRKNLSGIRSQGVRHSRTLQSFPARPPRPSQCVREGNPAYPVTDCYADRKIDSGHWPNGD